MPQREVATLDADDTLDLADDVMRLGRVRHFPILEGGRLVGVLSQRDLFCAAASSLLKLGHAASREWLAKIPIRTVMSKAVQSIGPDAPIAGAVDTMLGRKIGCLPVVEHGQLVGLLSETDCLRHLSHVLASAGADRAPSKLPPAE